MHEESILKVVTIKSGYLICYNYNVAEMLSLKHAYGNLENTYSFHLSTSQGLAFSSAFYHSPNVPSITMKLASVMPMDSSNRL